MRKTAQPSVRQLLQSRASGGGFWGPERVATMSSMATTEHEVSLVSLTAGAAEKIKGLMAEEQEGDHELESHGVPVVVDPFSAPYLAGTEIERVECLQAGFAISNPTVYSSC